MARPHGDLKEEYVRCITLGHAWDDNPHTEHKATFGWLLPFRCTRCGTERLDIIDAHGAVAARRYIWPDAYRAVKKGKRDSFRRELRFRVYASSAEMLEVVNG